MKRNFFKTIWLLLLLSCEDRILPSSYEVCFPEWPSQWLEVLGEGQWRVEWVSPSGKTETADYDGNGALVIALGHAWPGAVLAWPYWPGGGIYPGMFRPAGALYPLDAGDRRIQLSWQAGPEAFFYTVLGAAGSPGSQRSPQYFDWPRFREYLRAEAPEPVRENPWLVNWRTAAQNTARSGFRTSLVRVEAGEPALITVPGGGPWVGVSPFTGAFPWIQGDSAELDLKDEAELFVSPGGLLFCSNKGIVWVPR
jgi:hypothetical protein